MIINSDKLSLSYEELETIFNAALQKEMQDWEKEKNIFFSHLSNGEERSSGEYIPEPVFRLWLDIPKKLVNGEIYNKLRLAIKSAGWEIVSYTWQEDERTLDDKLYIHIKK